MKSAFGGSGFGGKGDGPMEFTAAGAWFPLIKWGLIGLGVIVGLLVLFNSVFKVTRSEAGYEGVEINLAGAQRGAQDIPVRTGWVFYSPLRTQIIEFPTFVQTVKWTRDLAEGHANNEEMSFNTKEGMNVYADVSLSYAIEPARVPDFYEKYRVNELEYFTHGILRDVVRNSLNEVASTFTVEDILWRAESRVPDESTGDDSIEGDSGWSGNTTVWIHWSAASSGRDCYIHHGKGAGDPGSGTGAERAGNDAGRSREKNCRGGRRCAVGHQSGEG
jgi:SPFH domain / Band 7 family